MVEKVQCIYMDLPYEVRYSGNFQPFIKKSKVTDGKNEDLTTEPEVIKVFSSCRGVQASLMRQFTTACTT